MLFNLFRAFAKIFEKISKKRLLYITPNTHNSLGSTAVRSVYGFWYVGNVFDSADIAYGIAQNGTIEPPDTKLVDTILEKISRTVTPVVYDIGANTGFYGVLAAYKFNSRVESFEPVSEHVACIEETKRLNRLDTLHTHTIALGESEANLELSLAGSGSTLISDFLGDATHTEKRIVPIKPLDSLNLPAPHFIKIDVEGFEYQVLKGATKTITENLPICFIEISNTFTKRNFKNPHFDETISFFTNRGYTVWRNETNLLPFNKKDIPDGVSMYLFIPPWFTL